MHIRPDAIGDFVTVKPQYAAKSGVGPQNIVVALQSFPDAGVVLDAKGLEKLRRIGVSLPEFRFAIRNGNNDDIGGQGVFREVRNSGGVAEMRDVGRRFFIIILTGNFGGDETEADPVFAGDSVGENFVQRDGLG